VLQGRYSDRVFVDEHLRLAERDGLLDRDEVHVGLEARDTHGVLRVDQQLAGAGQVRGGVVADRLAVAGDRIQGGLRRGEAGHDDSFCAAVRGPIVWGWSRTLQRV